MWIRNKKTGRVCDAIVRERINSDGSYSTIVCTIKKHEPGDILAEYYSLAKLYEEWEDYKPAEPQIADEMAREIVKKWYNKNKIVGKLCSYGGESWLGLRGSDKNGCDWKIELHVSYNSMLKDDKLYSLIELIGEEE